MAANKAQETAQQLREERFFDLPIEKARPLIKAAVEEALGLELEEVARGMWIGRRHVSFWRYEDVVVRALSTERGTSVEVRLEPGGSTQATVVGIGVLLAAIVLVIPFLLMIGYIHSESKQQLKERLVNMHKIWTEIGDAIGAPQRASYRDAPKRIYQPRRDERLEAEHARAQDEQALAEAEQAGDAEQASRLR